MFVGGLVCYGVSTSAFKAEFVFNDAFHLAGPILAAVCPTSTSIQVADLGSGCLFICLSVCLFLLRACFVCFVCLVCLRACLFVWLFALLS